MQSFNIVNTAVILLFSKKWVPGLTAEDNTSECQHACSTFFLPTIYFIIMKLLAIL